jgi:thiol-disulfide isomerase/thioredoxin
VTRRHFLYGGLGAVACLTGIGTAWWDSRQAHPQPEEKAPEAPRAAADAGASFWQLSFETPEGQMLAMSSFRGKRLLVNFWATWCPPCVEELPLLDYFYQENKDKNWQLLGLAVDQPTSVQTWLKTHRVSFPVGLAGLSGTELSKSLGNTAGSLPFSVLFDPAGQIVQRKLGKVPPEDLGAWAQLK